MKKEELRKIIQEEVSLAIKEAYMDQDIPVAAVILKSIANSQKYGNSTPIGKMAIHVRDGILHLGDEIRKAEALDINSEEFKKILTDKNINNLGNILNSYLGMENIFVTDFEASLRQMQSGQKPKNTDDVSTVGPQSDQAVTKR